MYEVQEQKDYSDNERETEVVEEEDDIEKMIVSNDIPEVNVEEESLEEDESAVDMNEVAEVLRDQEIAMQLKKEEIMAMKNTIEALTNQVAALYNKTTGGIENTGEAELVAITKIAQELKEENERIRYQNELAISRLE